MHTLRAHPEQSLRAQGRCDPGALPDPDVAHHRAQAAERERDRLAEEVAFLRARLVNAEIERQELRVLLAQQAHALAGLSEPRALPPAPSATDFLAGAPAIRPTPEPERPTRLLWWQRRR